MLKQYYNNLGINEEVYQFCSDIEEKLRERFQEIDRIAEYTDRVYVTSLGSWEDSSHVEPLNGTIKVTSSLQTGIEVECSHSNDVLRLQPWFKENRDCPSQWASGEENASFRLKRRL